MGTPAKRLATVSLAAACFFVAAIAGCDKMESPQRQADEKVDSYVETGLTKATTNPSDASALQNLKAATALTGASDASKVQANVIYAERAFALAQGRLAELAGLQIQIDNQQRDLDSLAESMATYNAAIAAEKLSDPKPALDQIDKSLQDLNAKKQQAQADIDKLQSDVAAKQKEIDDLQAAITKASADSAAQMDASNQAAGKESLDLYKGAVALNEDANKKRLTLDAAQAELVHMKAALDNLKRDKTATVQSPDGSDELLLKGELAIINDSIAQLEAQKATLTNGWTATQAQIASQSDMLADATTQATDSSATTQPAGPPPPESVADAYARMQKAVATLKDLVARQDEIRGDILARLEDAEKHAADAGKIAGNVNRALENQISDLKDRPDELASLKLEASLFVPHRFELLEGRIEQAKGTLLAQQYTALQPRILTADHLADALKPTGKTFTEDCIDNTLTTPSDKSTGKITVAANTIRESAAGHFKDAITHLTNAEGASAYFPKEDSNAAKVLHLYTLYAHMQMNPNDNTADQTAAQTLEGQVKDLLPPATDLPAPPSTPAPSTEPTTAPSGS